MRELIIKVDDPSERAWDGGPKVVETRELIRCKDCKHRPYDEQKGKGYLLQFPDDTCPCQNQNDSYYSWYPSDDWFCPDGERR